MVRRLARVKLTPTCSPMTRKAALWTDREPPRPRRGRVPGRPRPPASGPSRAATGSRTSRPTTTPTTAQPTVNSSPARPPGRPPAAGTPRSARRRRPAGDDRHEDDDQQDPQVLQDGDHALVGAEVTGHRDDPGGAPAIIENAPVTGLIPRCSRISRPGPEAEGERRDGHGEDGQPIDGDGPQGLEVDERAHRDPEHGLPAAVATVGTATRRGNARARTSPASRPANSVGEGSPSAEEKARGDRTADGGGEIEQLPPGRSPTRPLCPCAARVARSRSAPVIGAARRRGPRRPRARRREGRGWCAPRTPGSICGPSRTRFLELVDVLREHRIADTTCSRTAAKSMSSTAASSATWSRGGMWTTASNCGWTAVTARPEFGDVDPGPPPADEEDRDADHDPAHDHGPAHVEQELEDRSRRDEDPVDHEPDRDGALRRPAPQAVHPDAGDPPVQGHQTPDADEEQEQRAADHPARSASSRTRGSRRPADRAGRRTTTAAPPARPAPPCPARGRRAPPQPWSRPSSPPSLSMSESMGVRLSTSSSDTCRSVAVTDLQRLRPRRRHLGGRRPRAQDLRSLAAALAGILDGHPLAEEIS